MLNSIVLFLLNINFLIQQEEIGFEGGPQSWPAFTESRVKSSYRERCKIPPSIDNAKLDLTQKNYQSKFCSLLYWEEEGHIELLHQKYVMIFACQLSV